MPEKRDISFDLSGKTITFLGVSLPDAKTPLPPTNATIHVLDHEDGYGTPQRTFVAICGQSWMAVNSAGEHKWLGRDETQWHKHLNCSRCLTALAA